MCRTLARGGARCARCTTPGSPWTAAERAVTRAEQVATAARAEAAEQFDAAYDALFTVAADRDVTPQEWAQALASWMDRVSTAWVALCRALERAHERRVAALDVRWAAHLADLMAEVRAERYARERAALDHLHATELHLAAVELQASTPDWSDPFWHEEQWAALDTVASELGVESRRLVRLERRTAARAHPDPRVLADLRSTRARVRCWQTTMQRQRATLLDLPRTPTEADEAVAAARAKVAAARASTGLTDDEHAYLASPVLAAVVERSRAHQEERVGRPARA